MISCTCWIGSAYCSAPRVKTTSWRGFVCSDMVPLPIRRSRDAALDLARSARWRARVTRFALGENLGDAEAELLVDHHHLAARDGGAVDEQINRFASHSVERDDRSRAQL